MMVNGRLYEHLYSDRYRLGPANNVNKLSDKQVDHGY